MLAHGFGGSKADSAEVGRTLARDGYTVITYTARGFGRSGGLIHLDNPAYEGVDARRLIDFAAERPEVAKAGGDPVIGFAGASYGGAASILAAGLDPRVDAIVPAFTWHSLTQALVPQYAVNGTQSSAAYVSPDRHPGNVQGALGGPVLRRSAGPSGRRERQPVRTLRPGDLSGLRPDRSARAAGPRADRPARPSRAWTGC